MLFGTTVLISAFLSPQGILHFVVPLAAHFFWQGVAVDVWHLVPAGAGEALSVPVVFELPSVAFTAGTTLMVESAGNVFTIEGVMDVRVTTFLSALVAAVAEVCADAEVDIKQTNPISAENNAIFLISLFLFN